MNKLILFVALGFGLSLAVFGCDDDEKKPVKMDAEIGSDGASDGDSDSDTDTDPDVVVGSGLAEDIFIQRIDIYQSVQVPLLNDGQHVESTTPVVAGRDTMMRIYVAPMAGWSSKTIGAQVTVTSGGQSNVYEGTALINGSSEESNLGSTLNVDIPGSVIGADTLYNVALVDPGDEHADGSANDARWPANVDAVLETSDVGGPLQIRVIPIQWAVDGSSRFPNTDSASLALLETAFMALFPLAEVNIAVSNTPLIWNQQVTADGGGWETLLNEITMNHPNG